jgi:hypothetical protein
MDELTATKPKDKNSTMPCVKKTFGGITAKPGSEIG